MSWNKNRYLEIINKTNTIKEVGKYSKEPVETSYGYHIIKRVPLSYEKDGASAANFQQNMSSDLITEYLNANTPEWKKEFNIVEDCTTFIFAIH